MQVLLALVALVVLVPTIAGAQPAPGAQAACTRSAAEASMRERRYADALACLDDVVRQEGALPALEWARAVAALLAGDTARAERHALACLSDSASDASRSSGCAQVLERARALAPPPPEPPVAVEAPSPPLPVSIAPRPTVVSVSARAQREPSRVGPVVLWTTAAVTLAGAGSLAIARAAVLEPCAVQGERAVCPDADSLASARRAPSLALGANVLLGVGLACVAAGTAWWIASSVSVTADPSTGSASVTVGGRW